VTAWCFRRSSRKSINASRETVDSRKMTDTVSTEAQCLTASAESVESGASKPPSSRLEIDLLFDCGLAEECLSHLDVARHSDTLVTLKRLAEQRLRFFAITWGSAID